MKISNKQLRFQPFEFDKEVVAISYCFDEVSRGEHYHFLLVDALGDEDIVLHRVTLVLTKEVRFFVDNFGFPKEERLTWF
jgi:hypothetical protein